MSERWRWTGEIDGRTITIRVSDLTVLMDVDDGCHTEQRELSSALAMALKASVDERAKERSGDACYWRDRFAKAERDIEHAALALGARKGSAYPELPTLAESAARRLDAVTRQRDDADAAAARLRRREEAIVEAMGGVADGGAYVNDIVGKIERIRREAGRARAVLAQVISARSRSGTIYPHGADEDVIMRCDKEWRAMDAALQEAHDGLAALIPGGK